MSSEVDRSSELQGTDRESVRCRKPLRATTEDGEGASLSASVRSRMRIRGGYRYARNYPVYSGQKASDTVNAMLGLSSRSPDDQLVNVFLSFSTSDHRWASLFDRELSYAFVNLQFLGQPLTNRYERNWQQKCNEKIQDSALLICLVGEQTHASTAVAWEVGRAIDLDKPILPVALDERAARLPPILRANSMAPLYFCNCLTHPDVFTQVSQIKT